ncbi:hypothetical protein [Salinisphaera aquimarina]|uniref:Uncharacterized protein n=1 Tax=Salinisphaera aquimarina TaxID=2094031 RepID=A0ABV7EQR7_9GAMM
MDQRHSSVKVSHPLLRTGLIMALALAPLAAAQAYVGPGAGLSLLGALWGVIAAIGAALLFVITWPLRRMRRRKRDAAKEAEQTNAANSTPGDTASSSDPADKSAPRS